MLDKNDNILLNPSPLKAIGSIMGIFEGNRRKKDAQKKGRQAREKAAAAEKALGAAKDAYKNIDITNPFADATNAFAGMDNAFADSDNVFEGADNVYEGADNVYSDMKNKFEGQKNAFEDMENAMEDLTVNTQQAEFEAQQNQQMQANILSEMSGAAGSSGIAALAQSMANSGALQAQKASASIGSQEAANQKLAAQASQDIAGKTATEQSRLDTQKNQADMDIQKTIMSADEALQSAKLGEASKLQMAEMQEASNLQMAEMKEQSNLQMAEAQGAMDVQKLKGEGEIHRQGSELTRGGKLLDQATLEMAGAQAAVDKADAQEEAARSQVTESWSGLFNPLSDNRMKENIEKLGYSKSNIPIYKFNYIGNDKTWTGTMAQDLLKIGRGDAVTKGEDGYYRVNYKVIDVNMEEYSTPSPLKQLTPPQGGDQQGGGAQTQKQQLATQQKQVQEQTSMAAGMDILSEAKRRRNWEQLQMEMLALEPKSKRDRKQRDKILRENMEKVIDIDGGGETLTNNFMDAYVLQIKKYQDILYSAILQNDKPGQKQVMIRLANLDSSKEVILESKRDFYENFFEPDSLVSKGNSQQQISFATQIYCDNPQLIITFGSKEDSDAGRVDYYGDLIQEDIQYAVCEDFYYRTAIIPAIHGDKDIFFIDKMKVLEYLNFLRETNQDAVEARKSKSAVKIDLGSINYKINQLFGNELDEPTKEQDQLVFQFAHDDSILEDGSSFKRHLLEHPNIQNLNYGGLSLDQFDNLDLPMGEGDKKSWKDNISETDKIKMVDAIVNVDSPFFSMALLRTLVKEYYTYKVENAWWKGMGFDEGKLGIMRLKQNQLIKQRFERGKTDSLAKEMQHFIFDGKVYPTGLKKTKKMFGEGKKDKTKASDKTPGGNIPKVSGQTGQIPKTQ